MTATRLSFRSLEDAVLISGATGFLGMEVLLRYLLQTDRTVVALVRAESDAAAAERLRATLDQLVGPARAEAYAARCVVVAADLTRPGLGLDPERHTRIARAVDEIVHSAASVSFDLRIGHARGINVEGTRRMLGLAEACARQGGLQRFAHVSTAYVAGTRSGRFGEDGLAPAPGFRNTYEQSKHEAERLVRTRADRLPVQILRPSIVVGDRSTGWTPVFNVLYWPLRMYSRGLLPAIPADLAAPVDVVTVDYVADAILTLGEHSVEPGETFNLVAGDRARTVGGLIELAARRFGRPPPRVVELALIEAALAEASDGPWRTALERARVYFPYFALDVRFDDVRARERLAPTGLAPARLADCFDALVDYAEAAQWGRMPLSRADATTRRVGGAAAA